MNQKLTVHVTQSHIDRGERCKCRSCPIALALNEQHPLENGHVWLTNGEEVFSEGPFDEELLDLLPALAQRFARRFDRELSVEPFTFELELQTQPSKQANSADTGATL